MKKLVSVIMSVHNEKEEYLRSAVESISKQTYDNIEFIVVDDASDDGCKAVIASLKDRWSNIRLLQNTVNIGLTASLNKALEVAQGEYIARMDSDDYSTPDRIAKQVEFLNKRQDIDICGTGVISFGDTCMFMSPHSGLENDQAQCMLFYSSTLCHPSVMMRKSFLDKYSLKYDKTVSKGQDYDMWERCSVHGKLAILKEMLLFYRTHASQISSRNKEEQEMSANKVRLRRLGRLGITPNKREFECHIALIKNDDSDVAQNEVKSWILKLLEANDTFGLVDQISFKKDLKGRYLLYCMRKRYFSILLDMDYWGVIVKILWQRIFMEIKLSRLKRGINRYISNVKA